MTVQQDVIDELKASIESSEGSLKHQLSKLRTGRANISILDDVRIDYYGTATPLSQCAQLAAPEPRLITVKPWEKSNLAAIEKAISKSDLGVTPQNDGEMIRLPIPQPTEERRRDLVKQARSRGEEAKIAVRGFRRDSNELLKGAEKDKDISQDDLKRSLDEVQAVIDQAVARVDKVLATKEAEIMEV